MLNPRIIKVLNRKSTFLTFALIYLCVLEYLMSISPDDCIYPGCSNHASVNTYPVCYQHLDFFSKQSLPLHHQLPQQLAAATEGMQACSQGSGPKIQGIAAISPFITESIFSIPGNRKKYELHIGLHLKSIISRVANFVVGQSLRRFWLPHCRLTPPLQRTCVNIRINLIPPEISVIGLHFCRR